MLMLNSAILGQPLQQTESTVIASEATQSSCYKEEDRVALLAMT